MIQFGFMSQNEMTITVEIQATFYEWRRKTFKKVEKTYTAKVEFTQYIQEFERIGYRMPVAALLFYSVVGLFPPLPRWRGILTGRQLQKHARENGGRKPWGAAGLGTGQRARINIDHWQSILLTGSLAEC